MSLALSKREKWRPNQIATSTLGEYMDLDSSGLTAISAGLLDLSYRWTVSILIDDNDIS